MSDSSKQQTRRIRLHRRGSTLSLCAAMATVAFAASLVTIASAGTTAVKINSASNAKLSEQIVVSSSGRTLYTLSGETATHFKCKTSECFKFWPPMTVPSRSTKLVAGPGVHGKLGIVRRSNGSFQVTLRGVPLYRFVKDTGKGQANGQGAESFGGIWKAATAAASSSTTPPTMTAPSTSEPPYGY
jgi:predicted lipoprotein with Yx(FWY)xxD motif